jgi:hypothetical protein
VLSKEPSGLTRKVDVALVRVLPPNRRLGAVPLGFVLLPLLTTMAQAFDAAVFAIANLEGRQEVVARGRRDAVRVLLVIPSNR